MRVLQRAHRSVSELARSFASSAGPATVALHGTHTLPAAPEGLVEIRQYTLHPEGFKKYLALTGEHVEARKRRTPFLGCAPCLLGLRSHASAQMTS